MKINLDQFFDDQKPEVQLFGKVYDVDNDVKTVLAFQKASKTLTDDMESIESFLGMAVGKEAAKEILDHKFNFAFLQKIIKGITACMTGKGMEEVEKAAVSFQKQAT